MENTNNLEQIHRATKYYNHLQGLRQVPFGILFLLMAVWKAGEWPWFDKWQPISSFILLGLTVLLSWGIGVYYERTFGKVKQTTESKRNEAIIAVLFLGGLYLLGIAEIMWHWPVSAAGLFMAFILVLYYFLTGSFRLHYLVFAGLMALVSLLPLSGILPAEQVYVFGVNGIVGITIMGVLWLVSGLIDHWLLVRSLPK